MFLDKKWVGNEIGGMAKGGGDGHVGRGEMTPIFFLAETKCCQIFRDVSHKKLGRFKRTNNVGRLLRLHPRLVHLM